MQHIPISLIFAYGIDGQDTNYNTRKIGDSDARKRCVSDVGASDSLAQLLEMLRERYHTSNIDFLLTKKLIFNAIIITP
ncbi:hypothetical protein [Nostoc sp. LPT]|uniref:hypothetical protein n=1 Tax=Nostoc sp. LPT TaxID=2815387 RepID=UPI001DBC6091|nr:hypothetical protein [Nostoc sp. LPT]MBN4003753.1 hypothetical protein [Nostoc sp. LPT]